MASYTYGSGQRSGQLGLLGKALSVLVLLGLGAVIGAYLAVQLIVHLVGYQAPHMRYSAETTVETVAAQ